MNIYKQLTIIGPRKVKSISLEIFMPSELDCYKLSNLKKKLMMNVL